jgi:hypothetical protein
MLQSQEPTKRKHVRTRRTNSEIERDNLLSLTPGDGAQPPASLQGELADLKARYEAGEGPSEKKDKGAEVKKAKKKSELAQEAARFETFSGSLKLLSQVGAEMLCSGLPNRKPPTELEVSMLDASLSGVAQKHFDKLLEYDAELALLIVVLSIVIPRLKREKVETVDVTKEVKNLFEAAQEAKDAAKSDIDSRPGGNGEN